MTELPHDRHLPPLMSVVEVGGVLDMTPQGVRKAAARGQILGQKVGGTWVFRRALIERLKERREEAKKEPPGR